MFSSSYNPIFIYTNVYCQVKVFTRTRSGVVGLYQEYIYVPYYWLREVLSEMVKKVVYYLKVILVVNIYMFFVK